MIKIPLSRNLCHNSLLLKLISNNIVSCAYMHRECKSKQCLTVNSSWNLLLNSRKTFVTPISFTQLHINPFSSSSLKYEKLYDVIFTRTDGKEIKVLGKEGDSILDIVNNQSVELDGFGACEGTLACSTCHVVFSKEDFDKIDNPLADEELDMLDLAFGLTDTTEAPCISMAGCGFLSLYLIGAVSCLQRHSKILENATFCGASAGALLAACLACNVPLEILRQSVLSTALEAHYWTLGPFSPSFNIVDYLREGLSNLPYDAHEKASGRLCISLTRKKDFKNVLVHNWQSREDLIDCLLCSCFIPVYSGLKVPSFRGESYFDGGFSNNLPFVRSPCLTLSPFFGKSDICPADGAKNPVFIGTGNNAVGLTLANVIRFYNALMPLPIESLNHLYKKGYRDAALFLKLERIS